MTAPDPLQARYRQVTYWRLLAAVFNLQELTPGLEKMARELVRKQGLPVSVLDSQTSIETLVRRHPELEQSLAELAGYLQEEVMEEETPEPAAGSAEAGEKAGAAEEEAAAAEKEAAPADTGAEADEPGPEEPRERIEPPEELSLDHQLLYSKLLLNVFGPNSQSSAVTALQYHQWQEDVGMLEQVFGLDPGSMGGQAGFFLGGIGPGGGPGGNRPLIDDDQLREELVAMESDLIQRMDLREALKDDALAAKIPVTLPVIQQLFHDKSNLSGPALENAKRIIRSYVDQLAAVLRKEVMRSTSGPVDRSVPPKRVFRNLDLKRTIWKNLPNYDPRQERLYVDQLFYKHRARKELMKYFIVVVDQSGSMVDAMTQCAILASIFATLPDIDVSLIAFDTAVVDLTPWAHDPFEALMRTNLGGGNDGPLAMVHAREKIQNPRRTTMVWISDFYEHRALMPMIREVVAQGVHFIPVGSVSGSGYFSVDDWFRKQFKALGRPVFTGNIKKLIVELKNHLI